MERLGWMTYPGTAKVTGTALGVGGAMLLTFYKGVDLHIWKTNVNLLHVQHDASKYERMERLGVIGTALGVGGAMLLIFYKRVDLHLWKTNVNLLHDQHHALNIQHSGNRVMGSLLAMGSCFSYSIWLILQVALLKQGFYCGEEDEEFSCFSSGTEWQSSIGVPKIGVMTVELLERL
uniref:WAT1-related protein At1g25270-like n=1 Tax=Tanacetum cinerariifolium TaxID=118510 RepID=A0A6L2JZK8_TANCI|nr:WAT1-related protein At1g25270-like [Tanacetum cinerariifolium]